MKDEEVNSLLSTAGIKQFYSSSQPCTVVNSALGSSFDHLKTRATYGPCASKHSHNLSIIRDLNVHIDIV